MPMRLVGALHWRTKPASCGILAGLSKGLTVAIVSFDRINVACKHTVSGRDLPGYPDMIHPPLQRVAKKAVPSWNVLI